MGLSQRNLCNECACTLNVLQKLRVSFTNETLWAEILFFAQTRYNTNMIPRSLAIDYGTVRIGLAVSRATLADPLGIIENNDRLFTQLQQILREEDIEQIIVGMSEQEMAEKTREFVKKLKNVTDLPIFFADETLSSKQVHQKLVGAKRSKRQGPIDHYAAAEFLQSWIDDQEL